MGHVRNRELEATILRDPEPEEPWLVYADWLEERGDPRARLIALLRAEARGGADHEEGAARAFFDEHAERFLGPLHDVDSGSGVRVDTVAWHRAFLHTVEITATRPNGALEELVGGVLDHPSGAFLHDLFAHGSYVYGEHGDLSGLVAAIAGRAPLPLRVIRLQAAQLGDVHPLLRAAPHLERLELQGAISLDAGDPGLGALAPALAALRLRSSKRGAVGALARIAPLLDEAGAPRLRELVITLTGQAVVDAAFVEALAGSGVLRRLEHLGLLANIDRAGAAALVRAAPALARIDRVDLLAGLGDGGVRDELGALVPGVRWVGARSSE